MGGCFLAELGLILMARDLINGDEVRVLRMVFSNLDAPVGCHR